MGWNPEAIPESLMTTNGDLITRAAGVPARLTRASLAADAAFTAAFAPVAGGINGPPLYVRKTADESVTSSTTMQNDDHLVLAVAANATYVVDLVVLYSAAAAGDLNYGWSLPASATSSGMGTYIEVSDANAIMRSLAISAFGDLSAGGFASGGFGAAKIASRFNGIIRTAGTAGNMQIVWAQGTSNATATTLYIDSYLSLARIA